MEYHVLSNDHIMFMFFLALCVLIFLPAYFAKLARRDAMPDYKKGFVGKIVPWGIVLLVMACLLILAASIKMYPWDIEPQPSVLSAQREFMARRNIFSESDIMYGWANDYQYQLLNLLFGCVCMICWTVYAFAFKKSNTNWWRKVLKVISYIFISGLIIDPSFHTMNDLGSKFVIGLIALLLLKFARVKRKKEDVKNSDTIEDNGNENLNSKEEVNFESLEMPSNETKQESKVEYLTEETGNPDNVQTETLCKHCHREIEKDSVFCKYCGSKQ